MYFSNKYTKEDIMPSQFNETESLVLYIDESYEKIDNPEGPGGVKFLTMSGLVLDPEQQSFIDNEICNYKQSIFGRTDVILHSTEINAYRKGAKLNLSAINDIEKIRPEYSAFSDTKTFIGFHTKMEEILSSSTLSEQLLVSTVNIKKIKDIYYVDDNVVHNICFSHLVEMFAYFIKTYNKRNHSCATGKIVFEDNSHSEDYYKTFINLLAVGNILLPAETYGKIKSIDFIDKENNNNCLQLVDYIPHFIVRKNMLDYRLQRDHNFSDEDYKKEIKTLYLLKTFKRLYFSGLSRRPDIFGNRVFI